MSLDVTSTLKGPAPFAKGAGRVPFEKIARAVLGDRYELSLVICGDSLAKKTNKKYRKKTYAPNVLSFPLAKYEGEIFLNVRKAMREARQLRIPLKERLALLFIHGCFHLKGLRHGRTMEGEERRVMRAFNLEWHGESTRA